MPTKHTYASILNLAWPIILANAAVPLLGLVDTTVIGNRGNTQDLGAIALGSLIYSFLYWSFGFLRMSTTGFTAQAVGARDEQQILIVLVRALLLSVLIGLLIILSQWPFSALVFRLFSASESVEDYAASYFTIRIWAAPATLATFSLMGTLIGLGKSRDVLIVQVFLNGLNAGLDVLFAGYYNWGVNGIAAGTLISEWATVFLAAAIVYRRVIVTMSFRINGSFWRQVIIRDKILKMFQANGNIFIRTVFLIFAFAWFTNRGSQFGDSTLAANHILLLLISFSAFFLDGFAFVAEALVGSAIGSKKIEDFDIAVRHSSILALITASVLASIIFIFGQQIINQITDIIEVQKTAYDFLLFSALYVLVSFAAFQLDGIFIGAVRAPQMRNASIASTIVFLLAGWWLSSAYENTGLWWAFIIYVVTRAATLGFYFPALRRQLNEWKIAD